MTQVIPPVKIFTLEEANATLPLVRAITADLVRLSCEVRERKQRLELLSVDRGDASSGAPGGDPYRDELQQVAAELAKDSQRLQEYVAELRQLGIDVRDPVLGLVAFPARIQDKMAYYCWELGEAEVMHWRARDDRFAQRRTLPSAVVCGEAPLGAADDGPVA